MTSDLRSKMKILEGDLAAVSAENKRKRQEVAMQAVQLLSNPKTEVLTVQRSQLLTLILLNKLLVGCGFKDANDSFKVNRINVDIVIQILQTNPSIRLARKTASSFGVTR